MRRAVALLLGFSCLAPSAARAQRKGDAGTSGSTVEICKGCVTYLPAGEAKVPLVVLLHGDNQDPKTLAAAWLPPLRRRDIAMLAIQCPRELGCQGSYWRWNGEATYIRALVDKLGTLRAIDENRRWLVGWSGGASYMGYRTQDLEPSFAALVFHGGGMGPAREPCSDTARPVFFLVGDKNPLHHLAQGLRQHYGRCQQSVHWDLLAGADHGGEWRGLAGHIDGILDALVALPVAMPGPDAGASSPTTSAASAAKDTGATSISDATPRPDAAGAAAAAVPRAAGPKHGCSAGRGGPDQCATAVMVGLGLAVTSLRRRRSWPCARV